MRLNFSGADVNDIVEGIRRIGKVVDEQVALFSTFVGTERQEQGGRSASRTGGPGRDGVGAGPQRADGRRRRAAAAPRRAARAGLVTPRRVALLKGGPSLERQVSMRSAARVEDALERLGIDHVPIDVGRTLVDDLRCRRRRRRVRGAARAWRRGRDRPGAAGDRRHPVHGIRRACVHALHGQGADEAHAARGRPADTGLLRVQRDRVQGAGRRRGPARHRGAARLPDGGQAGRTGIGAGHQVRPRCRRRAGGADRRVQLRRSRPARAPHRGTRACGEPARGRRRRGGAADRRGQAATGVLLRLRGALRDREDRVRLPRRPAARRHCPCAGGGDARRTGCSAVTGSRAST